jgi:hypothetical protein
MTVKKRGKMVKQLLLPSPPIEKIKTGQNTMPLLQEVEAIVISNWQ